MAMNRQRKTSNIANIVVYDAAGNVVLPAGFTVTGLSSAGFVKTNASGVFSIDTNAYITLASTLAGYTVGTNTALAASDTVLAAFGKIQGQLNNKQATITAAALTKTDDTNVTLTLGGSPSTALLAATSLTLGWTGTLAATRGGTGTGTYTLGDILYSSAANTLAKLSGNTTTTKQYLSQTGTGSASAAPSWSAIAGADVTGAALTKTDDTNVTLTLGGTPATALLRAASITVGWTGTLAVTRGGTGLSALGSQGQLIRVNTGATALEYFTPQYLTANQSITFTASGDTSGTASGATSISPSITVTGLRGVALPTLTAGGGLLKYTGTGTNTWVFDTATYLTGNQTITLSGDISGTGSTAITTTLATVNSNVFASNTFLKFTVNGKGLVTAAAAVGSSDITTALGFTPENSANKGVANGYASLDAGGKVPTAQLPSYVDDVLEYANLATFPVTGETGKIYVALDTNETYRWSGSAYVRIANGAVQSVNGLTGVVTLGAALTKTDDTNVTLTLGGSASTALVNAASITVGWSGTLALTRGGTGANSASGARTNLGATTVGANFFTLTNPSAVTFVRINADNTVSTLNAADFRTAIGAGTSSTSGTVTTVSVVSANGLAGSVATASTTPAITLSTTVTGILKGNGAAISAAVAGTDYQAPLGYTPLNTISPAYTGVLSTGTLTYTPSDAYAKFQTSVNGYNQLVTQNSSTGPNASSDIIVSNNLTTDGTYYGDFGINGSNFNGVGSYSLPNAVYLVSSDGDLVLGTVSANAIHFIISDGASDAATIKTTGQLQLPSYTSTTSFTGTVVGYLGFDSSGNIITTTGGGTSLNGTGFVRMSGTTVSYITGTASQFVKADGSLDSTAYTANTGTVTSVGMTVPTGLSVSPASITTSGTFAITYAAGYAIPTTAKQTEWDTAYTHSQATTGSVHGSTTVGGNILRLTNPSAITFIRINADNTVSALSATDFRTAIGAGTSSTTGTVTSVALSLPAIFTVSGSPVTTSGTLSATLASQTANTFFAAPNGSAGAPTFRAIVAADIPTLNQNTTGSAGSVANSFIIRADSGTTEGTDIYTFNGSAAKNLNIVAGSNITITKAAGSWTIASTATGGTSLNGTGYVKMSGTTPSYVASIPNADLANSSITVQGTAVSLGGSVNVINGTGFVKASGTTISYDNNTYALSSHTHSYFIGTTAVQTSSANQALTGISGITFVAEASDAASISTTISSTSTFFDFNLADDNNNDEWRWRFTPSGGTVYNAMRLVAVSNTASNLIVSGTITGSQIIRSGGTASQFLKADGSVDSNTYITGNQSISISGDATGSGTTAIALTLATVNSNIGTFNNVTVNAKGLVTAASNVAYLTANQSITWTAAGDISGSASGATSITPSLTVTGLRGVALPTLGASAGFLRYTGTGTNTWVFDTNSYLTGNQSITVSGDATGSGTTAIALTLATVNSNVGTFNNVTVNAKGLVTAASNVSYLTGNQSISLTGEATGSGATSIAVTLTNSAVIGKVLTGLNITGGTVAAADTILTAFGKLQNQINGLTGGVTYQGTWNASTNTPTLASSTGTKGFYYVVSVAGSTALNGVSSWSIGDWVIYNGTAWEKVDNTDAVVSVNGFTGAVSLSTANISESGNLYYTDARARAAVSFTAGSGAYNSSTGVFTIPTNTNQLTNGAGFITGNQSITVSGDASGSGTTAITLTLATVNSNIGTFNNVTVNAKGLVTAASNVSYLTGNQSISLTGDVSGSGTTSITTTLATITQSTGSSFVKITLDTKGRVTGNTAVASSDITTALGYTPYNATNPAGYTSNTGTVTSVSGTGTVSGLTLSGTVTTSGSLTLGGTLTLTAANVNAVGAITNNTSGTAGSTPVLTASGALTTQQGSGTVIYSYALTNPQTGLFAATDNANSILTVNRHPGDYYSQLGFSSNGNLYYRNFVNTAINTSQAWQTIWTSSSLTNLNQLTNGPGYITASSLSSYLPLSGGTMTGNINWDQTDRGVTWNFNTDGAHIKFYNTGNGDTDSRLEYATYDDGNEYHKFVISGTERFSIKADGVRVSGNLVPLFNGTNASGTWGISITGSSATANYLFVDSSVAYGRSGLQFAQSAGPAGNDPTIHQTPTGDWWHVLRMNHGNASGYYSDLAVSMTTNLGLSRRVISNGSQLSNWVTILDALNYNSYSPTLTGTGASGTWGISISGNAATASSVAWGNVTSKPNEIFNYDGWVASPGYDGNTIGGNKSGFTYSNNAPYTGPIAHFAASGYGFQINAAYIGGTNIAFRTRNGDNGTWNVWNAFLHSANYNSYSPTLTGGGASGTWGINVTGTAGGETLATVTSRGSGTTAGITVNGTLTVGNSGSSYIHMIDTDEASRYIHCNSNRIGFLTSSSSWGSYCDNSGNWTSVGDITAYSDARVKENVSTIENALEKTLALRGVTYTRKDTEDKSRKVGVIAQEIQEVLPEVVSEQMDGMLGVSYGNIVGVLIEAIKEQQSQIENLKKQIEFLADNK